MRSSPVEASEVTIISLEPQQTFALVAVVTFATCALIVSEELRRRAIDARVLSAMWFLEPSGTLALLHLFFRGSVASGDLRASLRRLEKTGRVRVDRMGNTPSYAVTPAGLFALERQGLGVCGLYGSAPTV